MYYQENFCLKTKINLILKVYQNLINLTSFPQRLQLNK